MISTHLTCFTVSYIYELNCSTNIHVKFSGRIALVATRNLSLSFGPILVVLSGSRSFLQAMTTLQQQQQQEDVQAMQQPLGSVAKLVASGIREVPPMFRVKSKIQQGYCTTNTCNDAEEESTIPVIDFAGFHGTDRRPLILQQIRRASEDWGFFQVEFFCPWTYPHHGNATIITFLWEIAY